MHASDIQLPEKFFGMFRHFKIKNPWMIFLTKKKRTTKQISLKKMDRYIKLNSNQRETAVKCRASFLETIQISRTSALQPFTW